MAKSNPMPLVGANVDAVNKMAHFTFVNDQNESLTLTIAATTNGHSMLKTLRANAAARLRAAADTLDAVDAEDAKDEA